MAMIESAHITNESDGSRVIWGVCKNKHQTLLRFLGWVLILVAVGTILYDVRGWQFSESAIKVLTPVVSALVGVILLSVTRGKLLMERKLLRVQPATSEDPPIIERYDETGGLEKVVSEGLTHVVFGLVDIPWPGREGVDVEGFALSLAREDGTPVPVIEGTMDRVGAFEAAQVLSRDLRLPIIELGKGQP